MPPAESFDYLLPLAHHGDAGLGHHETALAVMLLVDADHRALGHGDVLVDDRVLYHGVPADPGVVQHDRAIDLGPGVDPDPRREHRLADQAAGDDHAVADQAADRPADPALALVVHELGGRQRRHVGQDRPAVVVQVEQ